MTTEKIKQRKHEGLIVGWREWVSLPELGIKHIKAKIDTGARTSVLHAFRIQEYHEHGHSKVRFEIHPVQRSKSKVIVCTAKLIDVRTITDSGGHRERRYVIQTPIVLGNYTWPIEISLTNRDDMNFRMLLGRTAIRRRFLVNPGMSYLQSSG